MPPKYKNLTNDERKAVLWFLQARAKEENKNGLQRGAIAEAATHFNKKHVTIQRIWNRAKQSKEAYWEQSAETVENVFITVQKVMECSMIAEGSNKFKLPHMGKSKLRRQGQLQHILQVPEEVLLTAMEKLQDAN